MGHLFGGPLHLQRTLRHNCRLSAKPHSSASRKRPAKRGKSRDIVREQMAPAKLARSISALRTEQTSKTDRSLDTLDSLGIVRRINAQDALAAKAVAKQLPQIAKAVDAAVAGLRRGGRLIYVGAGTSGRLGVLDAAECPPTF